MKKIVVDLITYEGYDPDDLGVEVPPNNPRELVFEVNNNFNVYDTAAINRLIEKRLKELNVKEKVIAYSWN
jgi:hypothetical protein